MSLRNLFIFNKLVVVDNAIAAVVYSYAVLAGVYNNMGWHIVVINVVLAAWGGSLLATEMRVELQ